MSMEGSGNYRGRSMAGTHTYVGGEHPAQNERFWIHGIFVGKAANLPEMGKHEVCVPKPRILVQEILRRYSGE